jgi:uncharacterized protein
MTLFRSNPVSSSQESVPEDIMRKAFYCSFPAIFLIAAGLFSQEANKFRVRIGKAANGTEEYVITQTVDGYRLTGKSHLERTGSSMDATHEETLTPELALIRYKLQAGGSQLIEAWRDGDNIQMRISATGQQPSKPVPFAASTIVLDNMVTAHFQIVLNSVAAKPASAAPWTFTFLVPQALASIPGKVSRGAAESATLNGKPLRAQKYTLEFANLIEEIWADSGTNELMRVYVPIQDVEMVRDGFALAPKAEPKELSAATFVESNVEFPSGALKFPATLCLPAQRSAKVPFAVLVHGSGPNDRDETIGPNKPFRDLAHGLAAAGIGTLRYDKRTFAFKGQLNLKTLTVDEETIDDAVAALRFVRALAEADAGHVYVLGHSQGATFAPVIADRAQAQGAILMAAAERPLDQVIPEQIAFQLKLAGRSQDEIDAAVRELKDAFARVRSGAAKDDEAVYYAPAHYWRDFLSRDPQAALKNTRVPVLILQGGKDIQVLKVDYDLALQAVATKPAEMREAHFFPNLNHLFIPVEGQPTGAEYGIAGHIPQEVMDTIAAWIQKRAVR